MAMWIWLVGGLLLAWTSANDLFPPDGTRPSSVGADSSTSLAQEELFIYPNPEVIFFLFGMLGGWPYYYLRLHPGRPWLGNACLGNFITISALILTPNHDNGRLDPTEAIFFLCMITPWVLLLAQGRARRRRERRGDPGA